MTPLAVTFEDAARLLSYKSTAPIEKMVRDGILHPIQTHKGADRRIVVEEINRVLQDRLKEAV